MTTRRRAKGRSFGGEVERFAKIPISVLESQACQSIDHAAFRVLVIVASDCWYHPMKGIGRNGTAAFTETFSRRWGFKGRDTLYRALAQLVDHGLLVRTRDGERIRNRYALYALGWLPITHIDGQEITPHRAPPNLWKSWKPAERASIPIVGSVTEKFLTDGRDCSIPKVGIGDPKYVPIVGITDPKYVPIVGNTSPISAAATTMPRTPHSERSVRPGPSGSPGRGARAHDDIAQKVITLAKNLPHLTPGDIARTFKRDDLDATAVRKILERSPEAPAA